MKIKYLNHIIVHLVFFVAVVLGSIILMSYNLFHTADNQRFALSELIKPKNLIHMLTYRNRSGISCELPDKPTLPVWLSDQRYHLIAPLKDTPLLIVAQNNNDIWTIATADTETQTVKNIITGIYFPRTELITSYEPITEKVFYPECLNNECFINEYFIKSQTKNRIPAFSEPGRSPLSQISQVIMDESRSLVSYKISHSRQSPRVVVSLNKDLIQTIQEQPGPDRLLEFIGYYPDTGLLRYHDPLTSSDYWYLIDKIGLYRQRC